MKGESIPGLLSPSNGVKKDNFAHEFLPLFYYDICVFTPIFRAAS
jgi:hypothetical protein